MLSAEISSFVALIMEAPFEQSEFNFNRTTVPLYIGSIIHRLIES
jgi:hypothetical protein